MISYIEFKPDGASVSGKTKKWIISPVIGGPALGFVSWYAQWRRYVVRPANGTIFDANCLQDITDFLQKETDEHNEGLEVNG